MSQVEAVHSKKAKQKREEQSCHKVVTVVVKTGEAVPNEGSIAMALNIGQYLTEACSGVNF